MLEFGKYKDTPFVAIQCENCKRWIIEQYWVRLVICPFCDHVQRIPDNRIAEIRKWLQN